MNAWLPALAAPPCFEHRFDLCTEQKRNHGQVQIDKEQDDRADAAVALAIERNMGHRETQAKGSHAARPKRTGRNLR